MWVEAHRFDSMTHLWLTTTTGNVENTELHHDKCHNAEQAGARAAKTRVMADHPEK